MNDNILMIVRSFYLASFTVWCSPSITTGRTWLDAVDQAMSGTVKW